jgi:2-phospho-L-lactate transferase/gluconeogenesis factor (CofD/UPF0052 family)
MSSPAHPRRLVISVFCGGRGGSNLIREFLRHPDVELNALINAYDDGLSTGELRDFIPGMLGPSDFRKNLSNFLHLHSSYQYAMTRLLEFRLSEKYQEKEISYLKAWSLGEKESSENRLPEDLRSVVQELDRMGPRIRNYLAEFFVYQSRQGKAFKFVDCSLGNLVFAGAYLKNNRNFNATAVELAREFHSKARLLNVTRGENRILVALKENGEILERESKIVGTQSSVKIVDLFFLEQALSSMELDRLRALPDVKTKQAALQALQKPVTLSPEARDSLLHSDIIIYGPGTQFSSLFPSYKTPDLTEVIAASSAKIKIFVTNIHRDHDIQSLSAVDIVSTALQFMGDSVNEGRSITHVLYTSHSSKPDEMVPKGNSDPESLYKNLKWIDGEFENPVRAGIHSGYQTVRCILGAYEEALIPVEPELDIYINLYERSLAIDQLIQEFLELPWQKHFKKTRLRFNNVELPPLDLPPHLVVESVKSDEMFSEVRELSDWASSRRSKYLVTLSGDGEYRLCDILYGLETLVQHPFAAVYGSRTQSRNQFYHSLDSAYGESLFLYTLSLVGGFVFSLMFALRFGVVFSDPLTGFRLYNRSSLASVLEKLSRLEDHSASGITMILMQNGCEIAEIPVLYRTFDGFTNIRWRLLRSFRNAWRIFF